MAAAKVAECASARRASCDSAQILCDRDHIEAANGLAEKTPNTRTTKASWICDPIICPRQVRCRTITLRDTAGHSGPPPK